jgi:uncharacterized protein YdiU (UPF0061 family)
VAPCWIRFGTFELQFYTKRFQLLAKLADYTIKHHFPHLVDHPSKYTEFFREVVQRTAVMVAHWQAVGFAHGVMNTDNFHILGITLDYGPFGFLGSYRSS